MGRVWWLAVVFCWACDGASGGSSATGPAPGGEGPPGAAPPAGLSCAAGTGLLHVVGHVQDDGGTVVPGAKVQLCVQVPGGNSTVCLRPVDTDGIGGFDVALPEETRCVTGGALRVVEVDGAAATTYCHLPLEPEAGVVTLRRPLVLHRTHPATALPAGGGTVEFGDGLAIDVDPDQLFGEEDGYGQLGYRFVDPASVCDPLQFAGLVAFSPELDVDGPGFDLRIQTDLEPLTAVAMFVRGGLNCSLPDGTHPPEAEWFDYGTGIVDDQGVLHASGKNGLPCLGWLGWYPLGGPNADRRPPPESAPPPRPGEDPPLGSPDPEGAPPPPEGDSEGAPPPPGGGDPAPPPSDPDVLPRPAPPNPPVAPEPRAVDVPEDNGVPTIQVLAPAPGAVFAVGPLEIRARVTEALALNRVELVWAHNGERYPCPTQGDGITCAVEGDQYRWTITAESAGPRAFAVRARNDRNRVTTTPERQVDVRIDPDAEPPRVVLLEPRADTEWRADSVVDVVARVSADAGVSEVALLWDYNGNEYPCPHQSQYVDCAVDGDRYHWTVQVGSGTRAFQIRATDAQGTAATSPRRSLDLQE